MKQRPKDEASFAEIKIVVSSGLDAGRNASLPYHAMVSERPIDTNL